jgi:hypothetical protein
MSAGRLLTKLERLSAQLSPRGEILVVHGHSCQTEHALKTQAVEVLGRPLRPDDCLVIIDACDEPCPPDAHVHHDTVIIFPRR